MPELLLRGLMLLAEIALEIIIGYVFYTTGWLAPPACAARPSCWPAALI